MNALTDWLNSFSGQSGIDADTLQTLVTASQTTPAGLIDPVHEFLTYTDFTTALADWLGRSAGDTTDRVMTRLPSFIRQAEAWMASGYGGSDGLRAYVNYYEAVADIEGSRRALPNDFLQIDSVDQLHTPADPDDGERTHVAFMAPHQIADLWGRATAGGTLAGYSIVGNEIVIAPKATATSPATVIIRYFGRVPQLTASGVTAVLNDEPDLYLWGVLCQAAKFVYDEERAAMYRDLFQAKIDGLNRTFREGRRGRIVATPAAIVRPPARRRRL